MYDDTKFIVINFTTFQMKNNRSKELRSKYMLRENFKKHNNYYCSTIIMNFEMFNIFPCKNSRRRREFDTK